MAVPVNQPDESSVPNPYVGPRAFRTGERIYGRERETNQLLNLIVAERIVLFYSPSGAGKTSLIRAALIPRLKEMRFQVLPVARVNLVPSIQGDGLNAANRYVFSAQLSLEEGLPAEQRTPLDRLRELSLADYLAGRSHNHGDRNVEVLIFDQFEEILTQNPADQPAKRQFFDQLGEALDERSRWALFSMREDFVAALDPYLLSIPSRFSNTFRLDLLGKEAAQQAIKMPASRVGVEFDDTAVEKLVEDLCRVRVQRLDGTLEPQPGPYVEPVQLQVVCHRLWEAPRASRHRITAADLDALGELNQSLVDQSLADYYAQRAAAVAQETGIRERAIREWFDRQLITRGDVRGTVLMEPGQSSGLDNRAIQQLVDAHLVRADPRGGTIWFELAHDRLIAPIRKDNQAWFKKNLSLLQQRTAIWDEQGRPESLLLREEDLVEAECWAADHRDEILSDEEIYLAASRALFERERRTRRLYRLVAFLFVVSMFLAAISYVFLLREQAASRAAEREARISRAGQLAALSKSELEDKPIQSILLAVEALNPTLSIGEPRVRAAEEALRDSLKEPHGVLLSGFESGVNLVAISPDGRWLAAGVGQDAFLFDFHAGEPGANPITLSGHTGMIKSLAFSTPDGRWLATGSADFSARLWDLEAPNPAAASIELRDHSHEVNALVFSPDGRWLATGTQDGIARLWELGASGPSAGPRVLRGHTGWINDLAFSRDGLWLGTAGSDGMAFLWDLQLADPSKDPNVMSGHRGGILAIEFSPDGRWLGTGSSDETARLWDLDSANSDTDYYELLGHEDWINAIAFSPDGNWFATASGDRTARLWDLNEADPAADATVLTGHESWIDSLAFSPDERWLATGSGDHSVRLWDLRSETPEIHPRVLRGHDLRVRSLAFTPDGRRLATGSDDRTVRLWDLDNTDPAANPFILVSGGEVNTLAFSPNGGWLAAGGANPDALLWRLEAGMPDANPVPLSAHSGAIAALAFSPDGRWLATGSWDATARLWDLASPDATTSPRRLSGHEEGVSRLAFSLDGRWLATASRGRDTTALLWDLHSSDPAASAIVLAGHTGEVTALAFTSDGRWLATGSADNTVRLWDLSSGGTNPPYRELTGHGDDIHALAFSPDDRWLATGSGDRSILLWDFLAEDPASDPRVFEGHNDQVRLLAFSPDGARLASGSLDNTIRIWNVAGNPSADPEELRGHEDWINALAFSPDGRWLASGSRDGTARLWDISISEPANRSVELGGHVSPVNSVAFGPDGRWLATGGEDGNTFLWLVRLDELAGLACQVAGRNFTQEEWREFFPGEDYRKTCEEWPEG